MDFRSNSYNIVALKKNHVNPSVHSICNYAFRIEANIFCSFFQCPVYPDSILSVDTA